MTAIGIPGAVHIGADELPFVDIGDGSKLKVIMVDPDRGLWIIENVFMAGYEVQRHKHTGPVYAYTTCSAPSAVSSWRAIRCGSAPTSTTR
jgi:streptogramin lyase